MEENLKEAADKIADELSANFNYKQQNEIWLLVKQRLIADRTSQIEESKQAMNDLKKLR